jgi:hypothetical protein
MLTIDCGKLTMFARMQMCMKQKYKSNIFCDVASSLVKSSGKLPPFLARLSVSKSKWILQR